MTDDNIQALLRQLIAVISDENDLLRHHQYQDIERVAQQKITLLEEYKTSVQRIAKNPSELSPELRSELIKLQSAFSESAKQNQRLLKAASEATAATLDAVIKAGCSLMDNDACYTPDGQLRTSHSPSLVTKEEI